MTGICEGRVVVVTGSGRGIGREHALEFARQGARVVVNDLGSEMDGTGSSPGPAGEVVDAIRARGGEAVATGEDVSDWDGAARIVQTAIDTFGRLDVLVNNAGILVVWLGSAASRGITGRVFNVAGGHVSVAEGWVEGPVIEQKARGDPAQLGEVIPDLVARAAPNADMRGRRS